MLAASIDWSSSPKLMVHISFPIFTFTDASFELPSGESAFGFIFVFNDSIIGADFSTKEADTRATERHSSFSKILLCSDALKVVNALNGGLDWSYLLFCMMFSILLNLCVGLHVVMFQGT